jgi:hypothetical protein
VESNCPLCNAKVLWVRSVSGLLCLDPEPQERGTVAIIDGMGIVLRNDPIEALMEGPRYTQHLQTCAKGKK